MHVASENQRTSVYSEEEEEHSYQISLIDPYKPNNSNHLLLLLQALLVKQLQPKPTVEHEDGLDVSSTSPSAQVSFTVSTGNIMLLP